MQEDTNLNTETTWLSGKVFPQTVEKQNLRHRVQRQVNAPFMRMLTVLWTVVFGIVAVQAQIITRVSAPGKFFVDDKSGNGIVYNYAAYTISNNTGVNLPGIYVAITNIVIALLK